MRKLTAILALALILCLVTVVYLSSCSDSEIDDIPPPGEGDDDDDGNFCNISEEGLEEITTAFAVCGTPQGAGDSLTITKVYGTSPLLVQGERYKIEADYDFSSSGVADMEPLAGCPLGSEYKKCSFKMQNTQLSGSLELLMELADCNEISEENIIRINVWFAATSFLHKDFCRIYLDGPPSDDDDDDNDTADDDDDDTTDDDDVTDDDDDDDTSDDDDDDTADDDDDDAADDDDDDDDTT